MLALIARTGSLSERLEESLARYDTVLRVPPDVIERDELFEVVLANKPRAAVLLEVGVGGSEGVCLPLAAVARTLSAADVALLIVVTRRPPDDPELEALRRFGLPFVVVRTHRVIDSARATNGRRVLVPTNVTELAAVPIDTLVDHVTRATLDDDLQGRTLELAAADAATWSHVLAEHGARPRVVTPWRARLGRWVGMLDVARLGAGTGPLSPASS